MKSRAVLVFACLAVATACRGDIGSDPEDYKRFVAVTLMTEEEYVHPDADDSHRLCLPGENPVSLELTNPAKPNPAPATYYPVALLRIEPREGLGLGYGRSIRCRVRALTSGLVFRLDGKVSDGFDAPHFEASGMDLLLAQQYSYMATNSFYLQVLSTGAPLAGEESFRIDFTYIINPRGEDPPDARIDLGGESFVVMNCGADPEPPPEEPEDPGDPIYNFTIPWQAIDPFSIACVTEKDPQAACHAVIPDLDGGADNLELAQITDEITSFLYGLAPANLALLARTPDRADGLLVSDSYLFVADDDPVPEGVSPLYPRKDLFRLDMETGDVYRLTRHREDGFTVGEARWSPSGDRIAYILSDWTDPMSGVTSELRLWDRATGETVHLVDGAAGSLTWSPDGVTIAFTAEGGDLRAIDADGTNERLLLATTDVGTGLDRIDSPDWHPTANRIVFIGKGTGNLRGGPVYVLDLDTEQVTQLTDGMNDGLEPLNESAEDKFPVWSPDGRYIAFVRLTDSSTFWVLKILDAENGGPPIEIAETREYRNLDW